MQDDEREGEGETYLLVSCFCVDTVCWVRYHRLFEYGSHGLNVSGIRCLVEKMVWRELNNRKSVRP